MRDPVLERNMFRKTDAEPSSEGVVSLVKEESDYERRKKQAAELLAAARERQNPENYKTLSEQNRPGVFRPVATGQPQAPQPNTQQQLAQMQAMGFRPVGMRDGGYVRGYQEGGPVRPFDWFTGTPFESFFREDTVPEDGLDRTMQGDSAPMVPTGELQEVTLPGPRGPAGQAMRPKMRPRTRFDIPGSLPSASPSRGILQVSPEEQPDEALKEEPKKKTDEKPDVDLTLDEIKARRSENIALAMIQAGLAMAGGQSPNALQNIAAGGISGLQAYSQAEKERRADLAEERKYREDKAARIQRAEELRQERELTRSTRIYDITNDRLGAIDRDIVKLGTALRDAMDPAQQATIQADINALKQERESVARTGNSKLRALGVPEDVFLTTQTPITPAVGVGSIIYQNGRAYRVTKYENGKPTAAEPID